ncbi:MAG: hypothetical protein ACOCZQ_00895 [Nanoarchaeota archaeon]
MKIKIYIFTLVFLLFVFPVYANDSFVECVLKKQGLKQCIDENHTPCIDQCYDGENLKECLIECRPQVHCIATCVSEGEDKLECKKQCDASFDGKRCKITCLNMCENSYCSDGECEKECSGAEDIQRSPDSAGGKPLAPSNMESKDSAMYEEDQAPPPEGVDSEVVDEAEYSQEVKQNDCYSVCHRFCNIPCIEDCEDSSCIEECYVDCSKTCRNECAGSMDNETLEEGFNWSFEFWAMLGFLALLVTTIGGWRASSVNRRESLKIMDRIENIFKENKSNTKVCISKLEEIRKVVKDEYAEKKLDESAFNFLIKRIEHYVEELERQKQNQLVNDTKTSNNSVNQAKPLNNINNSNNNASGNNNNVTNDKNIEGPHKINEDFGNDTGLQNNK